MDWLDLLALQGTLKSLLQHHSSKASILWRSAFFAVQLSHPYMTTGKTIALTSQAIVGKVMSLFFSMLSRLVITFLPRSKHLLISWLSILGEMCKDWVVFYFVSLPPPHSRPIKEPGNQAPARWLFGGTSLSLSQPVGSWTKSLSSLDGLPSELSQ